MPFLGLFSPATPPNGSQYKWTTFGYNSKQHLAMTVVDNRHLVDKTLSSSEESLHWEDFYGSQTSDLAPMLLDIYDALFQSQQKTTTDNCVNGNCNSTETPIVQNRLDNQNNIVDHSNGQFNHRPLSVVSSSSSVIDSTSSSSTSSLDTSVLTTSTDRYARSQCSSPFTYLLDKVEGNCSRSSSGISDLTTTTIEEDQLYRSSASNGNSLLLKPKFFNDQSLSYVQKVAIEIVETERTYVNDLQEIIQGYLNYLNTGCFRDQIGNENILDLFGNIEDIYHFNKELLKKLERGCLEPSGVARCFVEDRAGFSVYTLYCTNYPKTVSVLTELMRNEKTAEIFKMRQIALGHLLPLGSFLLKPVQRILKYHLLLQNMCKHSAKDSAKGAGVMAEALATMTAIARSINDMKRKHEHAVRVQEIQSLLYGWRGDDLTTYGELVAEGTFRIFGAKGVRHCFLFDKMLLVAKKREDFSLNYKTHIMCSNLMLIESVHGEPLCFHVVPFDSPKVQYTLKARSLEQKREWSWQLKRVILENYDVVIPSHARNLVMQLGQQQPDDHVLQMEPGGISSGLAGGKRTHLAPQYLDKRKQEKKKMDTMNFKALRIKKGLNGKNTKAIRSTEDLIKVKKSKCKWRKSKGHCELISSVQSLTVTSSNDPIDCPSISSSQDYVNFYLPSKDNCICPVHGPTDHSHQISLTEIPHSPTEPSVWLKQHVSTSTERWPKVGHSLPRSFQLNTSTTNAIKRPFTIASDKLSTNLFHDLDYNYTNSNNNSIDDIYDDVSDDLESVHHPEHRIYRSSSLSRSSLRSLVTHLSSKLNSIKVDERQGLMVNLVHAYNRMTKKSAKIKVTEEEDQLIIHRQGSSVLGARMAKPLADDVDYAVPCIRRPSLVNLPMSQPDFQENSIIAMDTCEDQIVNDTTTTKNDNQTNNLIVSWDNRTENVKKSNKIDDILNIFKSVDDEIDEEIKNSTVTDDISSNSVKNINNFHPNSTKNCENLIQNNLNLSPNDVTQSNKVKGVGIAATLRHLEQNRSRAQGNLKESEELCGVKSIRERLRALEQQTSQPISTNQQSSDIQNENDVVSVTQGWVKQVVERFQK
ncbi:hypothetical protein CHUAL_012136 [Chamberlinius hualienensis]